MATSKATMSASPSEKGEAILRFIATHWLRTGYAPSMAEIGRGVHLSSRSTVQYHLRALQRDGWLLATPANSPRSASLSEAAWKHLEMAAPEASPEREWPDMTTAKEDGWSFMERLLLFCETYPREHHRSPGFRDVADAFDISLSTAAGRIKQARWSGLLVEPEPWSQRVMSLTPGGRKRLDQAPLRPVRTR